MLLLGSRTDDLRLADTDAQMELLPVQHLGIHGDGVALRLRQHIELNRGRAARRHLLLELQPARLVWASHLDGGTVHRPGANVTPNAHHGDAADASGAPHSHEEHGAVLRDQEAAVLTLLIRRLRHGDGKLVVHPVGDPVGCPGVPAGQLREMTQEARRGPLVPALRASAGRPRARSLVRRQVAVGDGAGAPELAERARHPDVAEEGVQLGVVDEDGGRVPAARAAVAGAAVAARDVLHAGALRPTRHKLINQSNLGRDQSKRIERGAFRASRSITW
uniref:Uncharacterized protein n=1 Tax=Aegilops tauschii subsp. strangulata TaxID=200361 RepID=A0A453PTP0_AEGTS